MLSELARYVTHKEQPISMGSCMSFSRLCIRGLGQPMYKRMHHKKMVGEIKKKNSFSPKKAEEHRQHVPEASSSEVNTEESGTKARH